MYIKQTKAMCEKPVTRKKIDALIKKYHLHQSTMTLDCVLASKQFKEQAKAFRHYSDPCLLELMILDERNANAYLWIAFYVAIYEAKYNTKFIELANEVVAKAPMNSTGDILIDLCRIGKHLDYLLSNHYLIHPLNYTDYGLKLLNHNYTKSK